MKRRKFLISMSTALALAALSWGYNQGWAEPVNGKKDVRPETKKELKFRAERPTRAEKKAAAVRAKNLGLKPGVAGLAVQEPGKTDGTPLTNEGGGKK